MLVFVNYVHIVYLMYLSILNQVGDKIPDIVSSLESHPHIRRVTPHKKVTRTLKLVKRENFTVVFMWMEFELFI